ncbi:hypothetical protein RJ640_018994 [Escallonia rubra]|uniref:Uncharacterized protein n=1 Tax=Escallonia rubra TaxID=112253 RepID=A0AA88U174_9ASTE|nr:hypothetical protein RJ640_018994 [Escallonia rubra]
MKRVERKSEEGPATAEKQEGNLGEKLKRGSLAVGKRGGHTTPVLSPWRLQQLPGEQDSIISEAPPAFASVSARKLAASLWELDQYKLPLSKMHQGVSGPPPKPRRHHHHHLLKDKVLDSHDPSPSSPDLVQFTPPFLYL